MTWTFANLVVQVVAGMLAGYITAVMMHQRAPTAYSHAVAGATGGFISGYFLQSIAATMMSASSKLEEPAPLESLLIQVFAGASAGGVTVRAATLLRRVVNVRPKRKS